MNGEEEYGDNVWFSWCSHFGFQDSLEFQSFNDWWNAFLFMIRSPSCSVCERLMIQSSRFWRIHGEQVCTCESGSSDGAHGQNVGKESILLYTRIFLSLFISQVNSLVWLRVAELFQLAVCCLVLKLWNGRGECGDVDVSLILCSVLLCFMVMFWLSGKRWFFSGLD